MNDQSNAPRPTGEAQPNAQPISSMQTMDELRRIQNIYLELIMASLTGDIDRDAPRAPFGPNIFNPQLREYGLDWPSRAQTMIGMKRLANLRVLTESVIADNVPGDLIETGVWRGGACILMRAVLRAHNVSDRCVWVADSFEGLPPANELLYPADTGSSFHTYKELAVPIEQVQENFRVYDLLDEQVKFIKGWFKDTLPNAPIGQLALIRLDGDMYESTMDALTNLYPKLSPNGYAIIDDYHAVPACKAAVNDYCAANGLQPEIKEIDGTGVYWRKSQPSDPAGDGVEVTRSPESTASHEEEITRLHRAALELSQHVIFRLNHCLATRDAQIERLSQSLVEWDTRFRELNQSKIEMEIKTVQLKRSIIDLETRIKALLSSTSWRITEPVRVVKKIANASGLFGSPPASSGDPQARFVFDYHQNRAEVRHAGMAGVPNGSPIPRGHVVPETQELASKPALPSPAVWEAITPLLVWKDDQHLEINGVNFRLTWDIDELHSGGSSANDFLLGKSRSMVERSVEIGQQQEIRQIFEMGILKGGSVALYDQIFQPLKIAAIDYMPEPVDALTMYIANHGRFNAIKPYYGVDQADRLTMKKILSFEFPDKNIDLIIDDASHMYEETREAFNISFPYLRSGGLYVIEDWAWAHWAGDVWQSGGSYFSGKTALSNLLIELFMLAASRPDFIENIFIDHGTIIIKKGRGVLPADDFNIADHYLLRGKRFGAWL